MQKKAEKEPAPYLRMPVLFCRMGLWPKTVYTFPYPKDIRKFPRSRPAAGYLPPLPGTEIL